MRDGDAAGRDEVDYRRLAEFWVTLRRFFRHQDAVARRHGLTPQRYRLLLLILGAPDGSAHATVTDLSERLALAQSTVTELVARCERAGLIERESSLDDQRVWYLRVTGEGSRRVDAVAHELRTDRAKLESVVRTLG